MKQRLLKTMALGLMAMAGANGAWAERDAEKAIYCPVNDGSYDNILEAFNAIKDNAATDLEIQIWATRPTLGTEANSRIAVPAGKSLSITPMVDGIILKPGSHNRGNIWFLNAVDNATFNIGSASHAMAIEGYGFNDNNRQLNAVCANEKKGVMNITNVTFQKFRFGVDDTKYGYVYANKVVATSPTQGFVTMTDVTIDNCETDNAAFINSINTNNDAICLKGSFTMNHKAGKSEPVFSLKARIKLGDKASSNVYNDFVAPNLLTIVWAGAATIGTNVIVKVPDAQATGVFDIADDGYGLVRSGTGGDMKLTQAYVLGVTDAGAATLVLPFEATIPDGVTAYTLNYTAGKASVKATEVTGGTLTADTPVLLNAAEGSYKFVSTATTGDAATGSSPVTAGALTGVYAETLPGTGHYILTNHGGKVGFRNTVASSKVAANHAYLTADGAGARDFLTIDFGETTGIEKIYDLHTDNLPIYNLSGQRVGQPQRGIYIVNGKKVVIK